MVFGATTLTDGKQPSELQRVDTAADATEGVTNKWVAIKELSCHNMELYQILGFLSHGHLVSVP